MPKLILKFKDRIISEFQVEGKRPLTIGRNSSNDVVIDNLAVSGAHAKVFHHEKGYVLADLNSKNGTFVNQKRIKTCLMKDDDQISIGKHLLVFDAQGAVGAEEAAVMPDTGGGLKADQTMIIDTEQYREMLGKKKEDAPDKATSAYLRYLSGGGGEMILGKAVTTIGKSAESDIRVGGFLSFLAGATAATISKSARQYHLRPVGGFLKPKVNGQIVRRSTLLADMDVICIGPLTLEFRMPAPEKA